MGGSTLTAQAQGSTRQTSPQEKPCVLVELFTSEGCSSCPPADNILLNLEKQQPLADVHIITLSEHVSYWNDLGWRDPYSSALYSERQQRYATVFGNSSVYTPQMIVDGETEFVGNDYPKANVIINVLSSAKDKVVLNGEVKWAMTHPDQRAVIRAAVVEDNLHSSVSRGENSGRLLAHSSVVRQLVDVKNSPKRGSDKFDIVVAIDPVWKRQNLRLVVFAENPASGMVLGVGECKITN
jgi:hypothetical protein